MSGLSMQIVYKNIISPFSNPLPGPINKMNLVRYYPINKESSGCLDICDAAYL